MKYNKSQIMKNAWNLVKTLGLSLSSALKNAWATAKCPFRMLVMKEWFANKLCRDLRRNLHSANIFAVIRETEKAMYVMLEEVGKPVCAWVPKSCVEECAGSASFRTRTGLAYEEACFEHRMFWSSYR